MHLVLSGEGNSDLGKISYASTEFIPASMYYLIDKIIEQKLSYSFYETCPDSITFIPKIKLGEIAKELKKGKKLKIPHTGKKSKKETAYFLVNAITLAYIAKEKSEKLADEVIAILFRDSDGTCSTSKGMWEDKVISIENGFKLGNFTKGIAMVPKPKSEAWLLCALKKTPYINCNTLENRSGNDNSENPLKEELEALSIEYSEINEMIKNGSIDITKIDMSSFKAFYTKLNALL